MEKYIIIAVVFLIVLFAVLKSMKKDAHLEINKLVEYLKEYLSQYDAEIANVVPTHGPNRVGDIPHSLACVDKAKRLLGYDPQFSMKQGLKEACGWYWNNLK